MNKSIIILFSGLIVITLLGLAVAPTQAETALQTCGFTIPCPTDTPSGGGGGGGGGTNPTATAIPAEPTATTAPSGPTNTPVPTPEGGFLPTAEPCGINPTITSFASNLNVRGGPGTDYGVVANLVYFETRPITGRYEFGDWWQIRLTDNSDGWVKDSVVLVNGNTSGIPLVAAPDINSAQPTPGPLWQPTPNPACTPIPTPTATNTSEPTDEAEAAAATATLTATPTAPAATDEPEPAQIAEVAADEELVATATDAPPTATSAPTITPAPVPGEEEGSDSNEGGNGLLLGGAILVGLGALGFFMIGRRRTGV